MLVWLTLPFYDFCGFRSVAVNSVYKLQFFYIYTYKRERDVWTIFGSGLPRKQNDAALEGESDLDVRNVT